MGALPRLFAGVLSAAGIGLAVAWGLCMAGVVAWCVFRGMGPHQTAAGKIGQVLFNLSNAVLWPSLILGGMTAAGVLIMRVYEDAQWLLWLLIAAGVYNYYYRLNTASEKPDNH